MQLNLQNLQGGQHPLSNVDLWAVLGELTDTEPAFVVGLLALFAIDAVAAVTMKDGELDWTPVQGFQETLAKFFQVVVTIGAATLLSNMFGTFAWLREVAYVAVSVRLATSSTRRVYTEDDEIRSFMGGLLSEFYRRHLHLAAHPNAKRPKSPSNHENRDRAPAGRGQPEQARSEQREEAG